MLPLISKTSYMFLVHPKNLLSVHKFTLDNHVFIEFHPFFFVIKEQATQRILFRGPCHGGLYPLMSTFNATSKQAFLSIKPSSSTWHHRLGHHLHLWFGKFLGKIE
jgi:hypothetical protein